MLVLKIYWKILKLILGKEKLTLILAKQYNHVLRVHATLATDHFFGSLAFLDGRHVHASAHCHWIFLSPFSWRYSLIVYYCYWFDSAEDISQKLGFHADHVLLVAGAFLSCWSLTLTWTQFVLWLSSGFVDMGGGGENSYSPHEYSVSLLLRVWEWRRLFCRCGNVQVQGSFVWLRLQVQGGSSTMMRIALQHLLIGAAQATRRK